MCKNKCTHENAYRPHFNSAFYCEDCKEFLEYQDLKGNGDHQLSVLKTNEHL